jgi:hypothetical protein
MSDLAALKARIMKLEAASGSGAVWLTLQDGSRFKTTSKRMLRALQSNAGNPDYDAMMQATGVSDGSKMYQLFQSVVV